MKSAFSKRIKIIVLLLLAVFVTVGAACAPLDVSAALENGIQVTLYGDLIGLSLDCDGLIVEDSAGVKTAGGIVNTTARSNIRKGDLLIAIERYKISTVTDVQKALEELNDESVVGVTLMRNGTEINTKIQPATDEASGEKKLGLWTRDHVSGIGTLTYSCSDRFGALGHGVLDGGQYFPVLNGSIFSAEILGIRKGSEGTAGSVQATFSYQAKALGNVGKNGLSGISGSLLKEKDGLAYPFGGRSKAHPGRAQIISCIGGTRKTYDIEIIRAKSQVSASEKSMVLRVLDPDLMELTGGIVQGMSGSPIVQDGYWIGAVTHVFNNSPREGYGIYADWMM